MDRTPSARLHALADEMWDTTLAVSPTIGTFLGLPGARHDRMDDNSFETVRRLQDLEFHQHILEDGTVPLDRKSTRLNSSHLVISYAVFCLKKKNWPDAEVGA